MTSPGGLYIVLFDAEKCDIAPKNTVFCYYGKTPLDFYNILKLIEILFSKESNCINIEPIFSIFVAVDKVNNIKNTY